MSTNYKKDCYEILPNKIVRFAGVRYSGFGIQVRYSKNFNCTLMTKAINFKPKTDKRKHNKEQYYIKIFLKRAWLSRNKEKLSSIFKSFSPL